MSVKIIIPSHLLNFVDNREVIEVEGTTVRECLSDLTRKYPETKPEVFNDDGTMGVIVLQEGTYISDRKIDSPVKPGDTLDLYPIIVGG